MPRIGRSLIALMVLAAGPSCSDGRDLPAGRPVSAVTDTAPQPAHVASPPVLSSDTLKPCPPNEYTSWNLPRQAAGLLHAGGYLDRYELFTDLNPYFLTGWFDADSVLDVAVQIRERDGGRRGVAMIHQGTGTVEILGAGVSVGNGGPDWSWLWVWRVETPRDEAMAGRRGHDVLLVEKPESASGYLWWDGTRYQWTQGSD